MRLQPFGYVQRHPHSADGVSRWVDIYALGVCESDLAVDLVVSVDLLMICLIRKRKDAAKMD